MRKQKLLEFRFTPSGRGEWFAPAGEVRVDGWRYLPDGTVIDPDNPSSDDDEGGGELTDDGSAPCEKMFRVASGYRLLCVHDGGSLHDSPHYIFADSDSGIHWSARGREERLRPVILHSRITSPTVAVGVGDMLAVLSADGLDRLLWSPSEGRYLHLSRSAPRPEVSFRLADATLPGYNVAGLSYPVFRFAATIPEADRPAVEDWFSSDGIHTVREAGLPALKAITDSLKASLGRLHAEATGANLFHAPFYVVCAWRLTDGTLLPASSPELMAPVSEAPTLRVDSASMTDGVLESQVAVMSPLGRLEMRLTSDGLDEGWRALVSSLDVFVSLQAPLWDEDALCAGVRTVSVSGSAPIRAWHLPGKSREEVCGWLADVSGYCRVASVPVGELNAADTFETVVADGFSIPGTSVTAGREVYTPDFSMLTEIFPAGIAAADGRLLAWGGEESASETGGRRAVPSVLRCSLKGESLLFPASGRVRVSGGAILGAAPAVRSVSSGQLGEFPLYAFTTDGVWIIARGADGTGFRSVQAVSTRRRVDSGPLAVTSRGVLLADASGLVRIDGSSVEQPGADTLPERGETFWSNVRIWNEECANRVWVFSADSSGSLLYDFQIKKWSRRLWRPSYVADGCRLAVDSDGAVFGPLSLYPPPQTETPDNPDGSSAIPPAMKQWSVETLPFPLAANAVPTRVRGVEATGTGLTGVYVQLFACDRPGDWLTIAEGPDPLHGLCGRPWRWWKLRLTATARSPRHIAGVMLNIR